MSEPIFRQTRSISRRFRWTILLIAAFFIIEFIGLYFSSRSSLTSLAHLHEMTQTAELSRQAREILISMKEVLEASTNTNPEGARAARSVLLQSAKEELDLIRRAREVVVIDEDSEASLREAEDVVVQLAAIFETFGETPAATQAARLIGSQYVLEALEQLRKTQIHLTSRSDSVFKKVNSSWNRPVFVGALLALLLLLTALYFGLSASRRLDTSLSFLLHATREITEGNMDTRAEIVEPDEIGYLAHAFNVMTETLKSRTVSRDYVLAIIESMRDAVVVFDELGRIRSVNETAIKLFGYDASESEGKHFVSLFENAPELGTQVRNFEVQVITKDKTKIPAEISITSIGIQRHAPHYVAVIKDITERKEAELEMKRRSLELAAANRELEAFSYSVSHDLRAPLRAIDGFSHALLEENGDRLDEQGKKDLGRVRAASQTMGKLIDDLLNLSRLSRTEMKKVDVDLSSLVKSIAAGLKEAEPARKVEFVIQEDLHADADPALIKIALDNLFSNAWKYTSKHETARIEFGVAKSDGKNAFFVKDDGVGFDPEFASRLFGAFQRLHSARDFPGTGIGLATVQRIIRRHGGSIWAVGQPERGSTFYFTL